MNDQSPGGISQQSFVSLSDRLAQHVSAVRYEAIPGEALEDAKNGK